MSTTDREARKQALAEAKKRLAERRRERQKLKEIREQDASSAGRQRNFGQQLVQETMDLVETMKEKAQEQPKTASINVPGRRMELSVANNINSVIITDVRERYDKNFDVDAHEIAVQAEFILEDTTSQKIEEIMLSFMSNEVDAWPPKNKPQEEALLEDKKDDLDDDLNADGYVNEDLDDDADDIGPVVMPHAEAEALMSSQDFQEAFQLKSKWMERALAIAGRHRLFYEVETQEQKKNATEQLEMVTLRGKFVLPETENRPITSIDFSKLNDDWFLTSYAEPSQEFLDDVPDGTVIIWNFLLPNRAEYVLESQSMITAARFHPSNPKWVLGSTISGQIVCWDIQNKKTPILRTQFSSGHTQAVFSMQFLPTMNTKLQHILTVSNDAKLCMWRDDMLVTPNEEFTLKQPNKNDELATTCFTYPPKDFNSVIFGSDEGIIYKGEIHGNSENTCQVEPIKAHFGPISNIMFHPYPAGRVLGNDSANTYLTSSYDWSCKLWHHKTNKQLAVFEQMQDYVYDIQWSPIHPSIFAAGDGLGKLIIFDLNKDFEVPVVDLKVTEHAISRIGWTRDGKSLLIADSAGNILFYEVHPELSETTDEDFEKFEDVIKKRLAK